MICMKELTDTALDHHLDELAAFEPVGFPVVSLYLVGLRWIHLPPQPHRP